MELRKHLQRARHQRARRTQRGVQHLHHGGAHRRRAARLGREHGQAAGRSVRAGRPAVLRLERGGHLFRCARARDPLEPRLRALLAAVAGHVRLGVAELHQPQAHRRDGLDVRGHARVRGEVLPGRHRARPLLRGKHRAGAQVLGARPRHLGAGGTPSRPGGVHELRVRREDHQALPPRGVRGREVELLAVPGPHARPRQVRGLQDALLRPRRVRGVHGSPDALRARGA